MALNLWGAPVDWYAGLAPEKKSVVRAKRRARYAANRERELAAMKKYKDGLSDERKQYLKKYINSWKKAKRIRDHAQNTGRDLHRGLAVLEK